MIASIKSWFLLIIFSLSIPIIGIVSGILISQEYEKTHESIIIESVQKDKEINIINNQKLLTEIKVDNFYNKSGFGESLRGTDAEYQQIKSLEYGSGITLLFSIITLLIIPILSLSARKNRKVLFYLFRPGLFLTQIISAILVITNSAIIIFSIYFAELVYVGKAQLNGIDILGLVAVYTALAVCIKALTPIKSAEARVLGKSLAKNDHPYIWKFVESIATQVGATPPDTIIVGIEPDFFVTEAKVICLDGEIKGKSLYLSLPFCRIFTKDELTAIIGHEMAHFVGEDTRWSQRFYPIYRGAMETMHTLYYKSSKIGWYKNVFIKPAFFPALYFMNFFLTSFEKSEKEIGRERELKADNIAVKITSPDVMAKGLLKAHIYSYAWQFTEQKVKEILSKGMQIKNISIFFSSVCQLIPHDFMKDEIGSSHMSHPTDTHPTLSTRLAAIGIQLSAIYSDSINPPTSNIAIELIEAADKIEEEISEIENYRLVQTGAIILNNTDSKNTNDKSGKNAKEKR